MSPFDGILILGHLVAGWFLLETRRPYRKTREWAREKGYLLLSARYDLLGRPFDLGRTYGDVYRVVVVTAAGEKRQGWVYCSRVTGEVLEVRWKSPT